ncbi:unnamed protein product [Calypogeia fissa]
MAVDDFEFPDAEEAGEMEAEEEMDVSSSGPQKEGEEREIIKDGGLKKLVVTSGSGWETPDTGDEVKVHYTGTLLDGTEFDSSRGREPFTFTLGQGQVIKGWDKGIGTMKKGENAVFTIAPEFAYGEAGAPPSIPANATLKFDVELISWASVKDICKDGGIFKKVLKEGEKWETPKEFDEVTVKYEARLTDGTVVSKSEEGVEFVLRDGHYCPAISKAVKTMKKNEKVLLSVKPQYGFGSNGRLESGSDAAVPPNANLDIEVGLESWKTVEEVTDDKGVMKKILKAGEGYEKPNDGSVVKVRYTAKLQDGTVFEKKEYESEEEFFEFVTDEEEVIPGLDKVISTMKKGELALITISPQYAFGDVETKRELAVVPPNSTVIYELELVSFVKEKESWDMETPEKIETSIKKKEDGNALFKVGKYNRAAKKYERAAKLIEYDSGFDDEQKKKAKVLKVTCNLNNAACKLKLKDYKEAVKLTTKVLEVEPQNVKALYRRGQAYIELYDLDVAEWDYKKALELDPQNREIRAAVKALKLKQAEQNKKEAKMYSNMFARLSKLEATEKKVDTQPMEEDKANGVEEAKGEAPSESMSVDKPEVAA